MYDWIKDADIIDSRDIVERLEEFEGVELEEITDEDERAEIEDLRNLRDVGIEDFEHGATLIAEDYFETYAKDLAEDIGAIDRDAAWPLSFIDWPAAAEALQQDYTDVTLDSRTYLVRA